MPCLRRPAAGVQMAPVPDVHTTTSLIVSAYLAGICVYADTFRGEEKSDVSEEEIKFPHKLGLENSQADPRR
jgi:hypothetical protein